MGEPRDRSGSTSNRGSRRKAANYDGKINCGVCTSPVDDAVDCERCEKSVCLSCAEITTGEYDILKTKKYLSWKCQVCCDLPKASNKKKQSELSIVLDQLKTMREDQNKNMRSFDQKLDNLEMKIEAKIEQKVEEKVEQMLEEKIAKNLKESIIKEVNQVMKEHKEREIRENNLVFFKVCESVATEKTERIQEDIQSVHDVLEAIGLSDEDYIITKAYRIGSKEAKKDEEGQNQASNETEPRPLKVCLEKKESKKTILGAAKKLKDVKDEKIKGVAISADMTPAQRKERKERRAKEKRSTHQKSHDQSPFRGSQEPVGGN